MRTACKKTPILVKALHIRLSQGLWESTDFEAKIQTIKDRLGPQPAPFSPVVQGDVPVQISLHMPSGTTKVLLKSQLMKCGYFNALFSRQWKESDKTEFELDENIPEEFFDYLTTGSDAYKHLDWDKIKELLPLAAFFDLPELTHFFKLKVCAQLLTAYENRWERPFCEICMHLRKEIEQWVPLQHDESQDVLN